MAEDDKYPSQLAERFQVRLPDGMRDCLRIMAERNNRSMNSEIVSRLEDSLSADFPDIYVSKAVIETERRIKEIAERLRKEARARQTLSDDTSSQQPDTAATSPVRVLEDGSRRTDTVEMARAILAATQRGTIEALTTVLGFDIIKYLQVDISVSKRIEPHQEAKKFVKFVGELAKNMNRYFGIEPISSYKWPQQFSRLPDDVKSMIIKEYGDKSDELYQEFISQMGLRYPMQFEDGVPKIKSK